MLPGAWVTLALALSSSAHAAPTVTAELADLGPLRDRLPTPDDADVVVLYGGEQEGTLGTCGCQVRPRGSVARVDGYRRALARRDEAPNLLVNAGHWLDDTIDATGAVRADVGARNDLMIEALAGWDVLNVAVPDLPWLVESGSVPPTAVSANLRPAAFDLPRVRVLDVGGHSVAVTGVTVDAPTFLPERAYTLLDPVAALTEVLAGVEADLVVVLAWKTGRRTGALADLPEIDVLIEAGGYQERWDPYLGDGGAVWVRSDYQTQRLGELRVDLDGAAVRDRLVDLDDAVPGTPRLLRLERAAAAIR